ncbi:MAG: pyruvate:ferredoxin (flavodoxin) oxidoreductase [Deltaproteobacteria bacterium]|nr:pyruvate:ferredoxin (flavodoxin) oxidoreductase [Deltaproteobacteria bacterium]
MAEAKKMLVVDGNEAVARVAYRLSEVIAIYPITPSSSMAELSEEWAAEGTTNLLGQIPDVVEMQSEGGAAGAVHGALQAGAMATTFTASQGLLLMIPNLYKIAGELTPFTIHVAARTIATHALSIFGDHSDVMACRQTGVAMLCSGSVQEAQDLAAVAHAATLKTRLPFMHFFDGFRTSSEVNKITALPDDALRAMVSDADIAACRARALDPDRPSIRGTAQNPDCFFQAREACNLFYDAAPAKVAEIMEQFSKLTGRRYRPFDYDGHPEAEHVVVIMGSGAETVRETVRELVKRGRKVGVVTVRLYRPFDVGLMAGVLPKSTQRLAVMDRTREPGAVGEPLYQDVVAALHEAREAGLLPQTCARSVVGGRYGLSSKEFTPAMVDAIFRNLSLGTPRNHFTVGINDDVTHRSLDVDPGFNLPMPGVVSALFHGLGADGTVGTNKQSIKIIGEDEGRYSQGYFVYDSKKSGSATVSHLRFGPSPIQAPYLVEQADFVGIHQPQFIEQRELLDRAGKGAKVLINGPWEPDRAWDAFPVEFQQAVVDKGLKLFVMDADALTTKHGLAGRVGTVLQAAFFLLSEVLPRDEAMKRLRHSVEKAYEKKGPDVVKRNMALLDAAATEMRPVTVGKVSSRTTRRPPVPPEAPDFVQRVTARIIAGEGDKLPVSAFPVDGTWPSATTQWEKRDIAREIPVWDNALCIQCNKCMLVCPHAVIRAKVVEPKLLENAPPGFLSMNWKGHDFEGQKYAITVSGLDCTGCRLCVEVCPAKDKTEPRRKALRMEPAEKAGEQAARDSAFFRKLPEVDRTRVSADLKGSQLLQPLMEYSGACAGCGETPYIKLLTQLYGDRLLIANATGCSSIYGGNLPTTPYAVNPEGRGPAWANSLFEDNAEFGLGMRLAADAQEHAARMLLKALAPKVGDALADALLNADQSTEQAIGGQRARIDELRKKLAGIPTDEAKRLAALCQHLVRRSVWIVGGDGWAYDIGYGGLDHVLAMGRKVNVLVVDTEVYSNTGGQQSKSTPRGASARFAARGKAGRKKDLGLMAMAYGNVYVAQVAFGAKDVQTVKAFQEAESYPGASLIIAYSHCIAHGYDMSMALTQQKNAVASGIWPLYRYDPRRAGTGESELHLDSDAGKVRAEEYMRQEGRFRVAEKADPARYAQLVKATEEDVKFRRALYERLAGVHPVTPKA